MQTLSQRDSRWGEITIGHSTSKIKDYGCTLVCISILAGTTPDVVNAFLTAVGGFSVDRIIWSKINETKLGLHFPDMGRQYVYNDVAVREAIEKNGGCLVEVDFDGVIKTPNDRHWILYVGNGKAYDPWTGTEISTTKYPIVKGYCIINKLIKQENDMLTEEQKRILDFLNGKSEGDVREAFGALADLEKLNKENLTLKNLSDDLASKVKELAEQLAEEQQLGASWQKELSSANKKIQKLEGEMTTIAKERNQYKNWYEAKCAELKVLDKMTALEHIAYGLKLLVQKQK